MKRKAALIALTAAVLATARGGAGAFPLGFSVGGGAGVGYYSMNALNEHATIVSQDNNISIRKLDRGVNFRIQGRIWYRSIAALAGGYEHLWGETSAVEPSSSIYFKTPADLFTLGAVGTVFEIKDVMNICIGANICWADALYETNEGYLDEFRGDGSGYEAYVEAHTNFINPIEMGFQLGYQSLEIGELNDKFGFPGSFDPSSPIRLDYSGVFIYLMASVRIN
jgi:hypothetical protein